MFWKLMRKKRAASSMSCEMLMCKPHCRVQKWAHDQQHATPGCQLHTSRLLVPKKALTAPAQLVQALLLQKTGEFNLASSGICVKSPG